MLCPSFVCNEMFNGSKCSPIWKGLWRIEWSRDRWRHVTPKGHKGHNPNTLRAQYLENSWRSEILFSKLLITI